MSEQQIESLSLSEVLSLRARYTAEQKRRDKELRYLLVAITGNKGLLADSVEHSGPGPKAEDMAAHLDRSAMELSRRLSALGV